MQLTGGALPRATAFALAAFGVLVAAQCAYALYSRDALTAAFMIGATRGSAVFAVVLAPGALIGFGILDRVSASVPQAATLGALCAVPIALLGGWLVPSVGLPGAAGAIAASGALVAFAGGGGLKRRWPPV